MQTSVSTDYTAGTAGMMVDLHTALDGDIGSYTSEESSAAIPFGIVVKQGAGDYGALKMTATSSDMLGVTVYGHMYATGVVGASAALGDVDAANFPGDVGLLPDITFGVCRRGRIWVRVEDAVSPGDAVRVRGVGGGTNGYGTGGAEMVGAFRTAADSTDCTDISAFAKWRTSADAGELAVVEVDFTNGALSNPD